MKKDSDIIDIETGSGKRNIVSAVSAAGLASSIAFSLADLRISSASLNASLRIISAFVLAFSVTPEISSLLAKIRAAAPYFPEGFVFSNKDGSRYTGHDISCAVSRRGLEAGIPNVSIHRIRRTVSSILRTYLPARTVAALLGHSEETGTASYSYDVAEKSAKLEALEQLYSFVLTPNKR